MKATQGTGADYDTFPKVIKEALSRNARQIIVVEGSGGEEVVVKRIKGEARDYLIVMICGEVVYRT